VIVSQTDKADFSNFNVFHVFPAILLKGINVINFKFIGDGGTNDMGAFAIYDNNLSELVSATSDDNLKILYSSKVLKSTKLDIYSCPIGWDYDCSQFLCKKTTISQTTVKKTGKVLYTTRTRNSDLFKEDNIKNSGLGPYFPPIDNNTLCVKGETGQTTTTTVIPKCGNKIEPFESNVEYLIEVGKTSGTVTLSTDIFRCGSDFFKVYYPPIVNPNNLVLSSSNINNFDYIYNGTDTKILVIHDNSPC
jgi:hypothetical protein